MQVPPGAEYTASSRAAFFGLPNGLAVAVLTMVAAVQDGLGLVAPRAGGAGYSPPLRLSRREYMLSLWSVHSSKNRVKWSGFGSRRDR
ncbi:MAG: hypothetical protein R3314_05295 [Longimicrobiales bacterium]|nr:hypothetical protein [Longimicrobiales bacterium]